MDYKKYKWHVLAADYNAPFIRNYLWTGCFLRYPELFDLPTFAVGSTGNKKEMFYVGDIDTWKACHDVLKKRALTNPALVDEIINQTFEKGEAFIAWCQNEIQNKNLTELSNKALIDLLLAFGEKQKEMYAYGVLLPVLDFQGFSFVEGNLKKILKEKLPEKAFTDAYAAFTTPTQNSFQMDQEEDLLRLMKDFEDREKWKEAIIKNDIDTLNKRYSDFMRRLHEHTQKHGWVYYVYAGPAYTEKEFLEFIKDYLKKGVKAQEKLNEFASKKKEIIEQRKRYIKQIIPTDFEKSILQLASKVVYGKPRRKDYQSKAYWHCEKLQKEIGKRVGLTLEEVRFCPLDLLEQGLLNRKQVDKSIIAQVMACYVCLPNDDGTVTVLYGKDAQKFCKEHVISEDINEKKVTELKGMCACIGEATGRVKIINHPDDMDKMEYGDILVSAATTPAIVTAMKKAAAIVTDEGGLTCHAAIVSRELNIPCVVGTKIVTKTFKDGDLVEVDATKGIIKKLK
jgi:phosphohistidine swiveling domain-containing protein/predicted DNA-binding transcriptional regulator